MVIIISSIFCGTSRLVTVSAEATDVFDIMRVRWAESLTGGDEIDLQDSNIQAKIRTIEENALGFFETLNRELNRIALWSDQPGTSQSAQLTTTTSRLNTMTQAVCIKGSAYYMNNDWLTDIADSLEWFYENRYNPSITTYNNWYDWNIGVPGNINDIVIMLYDTGTLSNTLVQNYMDYMSPFEAASNCDVVEIRKQYPETEHTLGEDFIKHGYRTALVGKAHFQPLASSEEYTSLEAYPVLQDLTFWRNFDEVFYGFEHVELARNHTNEAHVGQHYALWLEEKGCNNWRDYFLHPTGRMDKSLKHKWAIPEEYHYDAWIAVRTINLLEKYTENNENFFLWASFFDPHPDYLVPEPWDTMYDPEKLTVPCITKDEHMKKPPHFLMSQEENPDFSPYQETEYYNHGMHSHLHSKQELKKDMAVYYGMVSLMDKYIGNILNKLDDLGLSDNTLVVFTTDHGHLYGHHGLIAKGPFHYEDMIKIPFIARYPGKIPADRISTAMQSLVDLAPTFLKFANIPAVSSMTGVDQSNVWIGNTLQARDHIICENHHQPTAIHMKTYVEQRYKITVYYNKTYGEIYDLQEDPQEINNLWDSPEHTSLKTELLLKYIWAELGKEPMWMPRIAHA